MTAKKLFLASYLQPGARRLLFQASFAKQVLCKQVLAKQVLATSPGQTKRPAEIPPALFTEA
jgi:hypothetical protein